ncbi:TPA: hypothetical protein QDZ61_000281 [Stenotrophomonas maltophilia]|nr:hypothetical protein [Stenotrophomonas maltophilia]
MRKLDCVRLGCVAPFGGAASLNHHATGFRASEPRSAQLPLDLHHRAAKPPEANPRVNDPTLAQ